MMRSDSEMGPIVIAAGGTGGHLFPGQALAQELRRRGRGVVLMTDNRVQRFDKLFPGVRVYTVPAATFAGRGVFGKIGAAFSIVRGIWRAWRIFAHIQPSVVIGFGGYPSLPPMVAALLRGIATCVHEQNAVLGRVNRLVASHVDAIASTFEVPKFLKDADRGKLVLTGNPVRDAVREVAGAEYAAPLNTGAVHLLVFGGSQGARILSQILPDAIALLPGVFRSRLTLVQQCRDEDLPRVKADYERAGINVTLDSFFDDMPRRIAVSHLVIGRAGASTVAELAVIGRPAILVPLPHSLDNDQKENAQTLAKAGAAWMIEQKNFSAERLAQLLNELFNNPQKLVDAAAAARRQGKPEAVRLLADLVDRLARRGRENSSERATQSPSRENHVSQFVESDAS